MATDRCACERRAAGVWKRAAEVSLDMLGILLAALGLMAPWAVWLTMTLVTLRQLMADHMSVTRELIHYVRWSTEKQTGEAPPPFIPEVSP